VSVLLQGPWSVDVPPLSLPLIPAVPIYTTQMESELAMFFTVNLGPLVC
jgi:hypothetical protein